MNRGTGVWKNGWGGGAGGGWRLRGGGLIGVNIYSEIQM